MTIDKEKEENYFDHDADMGIIGRGTTIESCFTHAAYVMFSLMADLSAIRSKETITFEFEEADIELAFVTWLNLLLGKAQEHHLIFSDFQLKRNDNHWQARIGGEKWRENIERGIEVKGATLTMLSVKKINHEWEARCVVDV